MVKNDLVNHIKNLKAKGDEIMKQGEKILENLDDIGKGIINTNKNILDSNQDWGLAMFKRFEALADGIVGLSTKIDNATKYLQQNNESTLNAVKRVEETIIRKSW